MAVRSKKDKLIEDSQKFASRGQFDKAARVYEQIITLEPAVISHRQKLADLLIKCANFDDARKELETVAKHFSNNGFNLKAIAVYKQLQKFFPADISLSLILAELNEKHGLVANALAEYKLVHEQYEKSGKIPEALNILERMQGIDPQNIPIKVKLAETYVQYGKKTEAYAVFSKTATLLIERNDNQALANVCSRVQQHFSEKPDFLFEVLSELIRQGNVAAAIGTLQALLRSDPGNKGVWELIIQAYQLLGQPQRVKVAYQHYLKYFPAEPAAILGLISSITAELNLSAALAMLDKYESTLISAGFQLQLEQIYHALDKIDPINTKVLEGLIRVAAASGNVDETTSLTSKLKSLRNVSFDAQNVAVKTEAEATFPCENLLDDGSSAGMLATVPNVGESDEIEVEGEEEIEVEGEGEGELEVEIEIEIEDEGEFVNDGDSSSGRLEEETENFSTDESWFDSIVTMFDEVASMPRGVKFGIEMESSDARSHFDLGQAFKEMGLFDEAHNEFRQASQDVSLRMQCLILQCVCLRERGESARATTILQALLKHRLSLEESCAVKYELASGYEAVGRIDEAHALFNEIHLENPGFRDVDSRLSAVTTVNSLDFSDEDLDDFGLK
jgi:tetratricopeptide (TPR) repeat protein